MSGELPRRGSEIDVIPRLEWLTSELKRLSLLIAEIEIPAPISPPDFSRFIRGDDPRLRDARYPLRHGERSHTGYVADHVVDVKNVGANTHIQIDTAIAKHDAYLNRYTNIGRVFSADGITKKQISHEEHNSYAIPSENGDRYQLFFLCDGTETLFEIGESAWIDSGMWDLYVNGIFDSGGYDSYSPDGGNIAREIVLSQPVIAGMNLIELRVNGKNGSSNGYELLVIGASLQ